jgi:hypothetical protein
MAYDIEAIRQQVRSKMKKGRDPTEFRAPKAEGDKTLKFRFYILPPLQVGDSCNDGKSTCDREMDLFAIANGSHYIDNKRIGCPRVINDDECAICNYGFDLLSEIDGASEEGKKKRSAISKALLPAQQHLVNIYFPAIDANPEEVRGRVFWYNAQKTIVDLWLECLYRDDDGGDPDEPLPFGVFYDECNAYLFQLEVFKDGQMNSYKRSKFLVSTALKSRPIAVDKATKKIDMKRIKEILAKRHNLWEKMPTVDPEEVAKVAASLSGRATAKVASSGGFDHDEDLVEGEEPAQEAPKPAVKAAATKVASKPAAAKTVAKPVATKAVTKPATKAAVKQEEPAVEEPVEQELEADEELSGEIPADEAGETVEESTEEMDEVDGEVDRLLDELNG